MVRSLDILNKYGNERLQRKKRHVVKNGVLWHVQTVKAQISLRICLVWSGVSHVLLKNR